MGFRSKSGLFGLFGEKIKAGQPARRNGSELSLPARILSAPQRCIQRVEAEFSPALLYRDNPSFQVGEIDRLRQELNQAVARLGELPRDLDTKHAGNQVLAKQLAQAEARIQAALERERQQMELVDRKSEIIVKKSEHIDSLQQLFEQNNATIKTLRAELQQLKKEARAAAQSVSADTPETEDQRLPRIQMPATFPTSETDQAA